jgi:hypothetical protein
MIKGALDRFLKRQEDEPEESALEAGVTGTYVV